MSRVGESVEMHYGRSGLLSRILAALGEEGGEGRRLDYRQLHPFDQLHGAGMIATRAHAERAGIVPGMHVLDLGCGLGGSSRYLAAEFGCRVDAVDLTQEFVDTAKELTRRCGLSDAITYRKADALDLPFAEGSFDHVWCHNVTMNIADKQGLAGAVARVLKPGGRFSMLEVAQGPGGPPTFPLPWAVSPDESFLATPEVMRKAIETSGLEVVEQADVTEMVREFAAAERARRERGEPPASRNETIFGEAFRERIMNYGRGIVEGRLVDEFILARKP